MIVILCDLGKLHYLNLPGPSGSHLTKVMEERNKAGGASELAGNKPTVRISTDRPATVEYL